MPQVRSCSRRVILTLAAAFFTVGLVRAASLVEVLPVTSHIVALHFDDGFVTRHAAGQPLTADTIETQPLATPALRVEAFTISSADHPDYGTAKAPIALGRKSKGTEYADVRENWQGGFGYNPVRPYAASEHWVYLTLPTAMKSGRTYTLKWDAAALNSNTGTATLRFDESTARSETVHVNALGYAAASTVKYAYLYQWLGDRGGLDLAAWAGQPFSVVRATDGGVAFTGTITFRKSADNVDSLQANPTDTPKQNYLGAAVWECDFSALTTPGVYRVVVPGIGSSWPFLVEADAYRAPFQAAMRGIFQQRSGIALERPSADKPRPAPHKVRTTPGFANRLKYSTTRFLDITSDGGGTADKAAVEQGAKGQLTDVWGWYQDAGDWDGYFTHLDVPAGLLTLYQLFPQKFTDGELTLPESGNGLPDLVDEGAWLPRYFQRLRRELKEKGWGTGGVGARVFGDYWGGDLGPGANGSADVGRGSWQDTTRDWYVTGEDPFSSFRYAGSAAQLADILATLHQEDPAKVDWKTEAIEAYAWAKTHVRPGDETKSVNGHLKHHQAYAAAALFRLTGTAEYQDDLKTCLSDLSATTVLASSDIRAIAAALYLTMPSSRPVETQLADRLRSALKTSGQSLVNAAATRATRWGGDLMFPMLVGQSSTPMISTAVYAAAALGEADGPTVAAMTRMAQTTADYFLGTNPLNLVWISGTGPRFPGMFNLDDRYNGPGPRRGVIPYGTWRFPDNWIALRMGFSIWWAWDTTYPSLDSRGSRQPAAGATAPGTWPGHEAWFDHVLSPQSTEYTVWQDMLPAAVVYGYLVSDSPRAPAVAIALPPQSTSVALGGTAVFYAVVNASTNVAYQWKKDGVAFPGGISSTLRIENVQLRDAGRYTLTVTDGQRTATSRAAQLSIDGVVAPPGIQRAPTPQSTTVGERVTLSVVATGAPAPTYQWLRDGAPVAASDRVTGVDTDTLTIAAAAAGDAGLYTVAVTNSQGTTTSAAARVTVLPSPVTADAAWITNMSVRTTMRVGQPSLIVGLTVAGGAKDILVRAAGPALSRWLPEVMADPRLELYQGETLLLTNENWEASLDAITAQVMAFPFGPGSKDDAFVSRLDGSYTVQAPATGPGGVLVEAYDTAFARHSPRLVNISARNRVGLGDDVLIAGFAIAGSGTKKLLARAVGPKLAAYGVSQPLADPKLEVYRGPEQIAENDDWDAGLATTFGSVYAFPLEVGSKDAALVVPLTAGETYTVVVRGADGGVGEALVELYEVP